jgi:Bifunctional DNA primase/polymerase, N-terminal/Family of unknown function (DUF5906)/Primase C terminal 2 (PriCT-2)
LRFSEYTAIGWKLCSVAPDTKGPTYKGWNVKPIPDDAVDALPGAGLLHALSGTACLDIDNLEAARPWLAERGVDLDALLEADDAVRIDSGRPNRAKLLYRMKRTIRTLKPKLSGIELRCATGEGKSVQDVLPPSLHKDTKKPYQWACGILGDWRKPPAIPAALATLWRSLAADEPVTHEVEEVAGKPSVDLAKLKRAAYAHSPNAEYEEWLKVGMQLHDGTNGAQEGLDVWAEWSRGITRKPYPGDSLLKLHWVSFKSGGGKRVASGESLAAELPADAEDFPLELPDTTDNTETKLRAVAAENKKQKIAALESKLVFVRSVERYFDLEEHRVIGSDNALRHLFTSMMPAKKGGGRMDPVKLLMESATKKQMDALGFHPGEGVVFQDRNGHSFANMYKRELPEPLQPTSSELEKILWLFNRIDDAPYREWLLQFFGHVVQRPGVKIKSAPLIWSETQGNGKTTLLKTIPSLLCGARYSREVTCALLNSDFNDYLLNAWHVNLTEFRAGSRGDRAAITQKLRAWITDDDIAIHPKGLPAHSMPNHFFTTATSNEDDAAAIDNNDRRWGIHEMHAAQFTEPEQEWIHTEFLLTPRAAGVLRHYFLSIDLDGFQASAKAPETEARQQMIASSVSPEMDLLRTAFEQCSAPLDKDVVITADVADYIRRNTRSAPSNDKVGKMLGRLGGKAIQFRMGVPKYRAIVMRNHAQWMGAYGPAIMAHISGDDLDLTS